MNIGSCKITANVKSIAVSADIHCTSAPLMYNSQKEFASSANVFQPALKQYAVEPNPRTSGNNYRESFL